MWRHTFRTAFAAWLFCSLATAAGAADPAAGLIGVFDGRSLPTNARPPWKNQGGQGRETVEDGRWIVRGPRNFARVLDLGPSHRAHGQTNQVEAVWATDCQDNQAADGLCIETYGRRFRLQPIHRPKQPDLLLTGSSKGLGPEIRECRIDLRAVPKFDATRLNRYQIRWVSDRNNSFLFELRVNGVLVARLPGTRLPIQRTRLSFEFRSGTQTIDEVRWSLRRGGKRLPSPQLAHARKLLAEGRRQLFLDDVLIEKREGVERVVNRPTKYAGNPIIRHHQKPWQTFRAQLYGTVLYDAVAKRFRMWYLAGARFPGERPVRFNGRLCCPNFQMLGYAESLDGFRWRLPTLGLVDFDGSKQNNLCSIARENAEGVAVVWDPRDPNPQRRYKAFYWEHDNCGPRKYDPTTPVNAMSVSFSADGKRWKPYAKNPVIPFPSDTGHQAVWDEERQRFVAYGRFNAGGRKIARSESTDFIHWSRPKLVFQTDAADGPGSQFYGMGITRYEGLYVGLPWVFHAGTSNRIDVQLAVSRDGIRWTRVGGRKTFIPNGPAGSFDAGCIFTASQPIQRMGEKLFLYYSGLMLDHEEPRPDRKQHPEYGESSIGVATLRRDGFVSLDAGRRPGFVRTQPLVWPPGKRLWLNADAREGRVRVRVLRATGEPLAVSTAVRGNHLQSATAWPAGFTSPKGPIRLQFEMQQAKLFSFWFGP